MTWFAFKTAPQLERRVWDGLEKVNVTPARIEIARAYRGRDGVMRRSTRPLLPGYALASVRGPIPWPLLRMIEYKGRPIIHDVLRSGSIPSPIPADEVERLIAYVEEPEGPGFVRPGGRARVVVGHEPQAAVISRVLSESRCTVLMRMFGSEREVETTVERLQEVG